MEDAVNEGRLFGLTRKKSLGLIDQVFAGLQGWSELIADLRMAARIRQRLKEFYQGEI